MSATLAVLLGWLCLATGAAPAQAGQWVQISCMNPDGSSAPSEGWVGSGSSSLGPPDETDTSCSPTTAMVAQLPQSVPAPTNTGETLIYTPPAGSTLAGGTIYVNLTGDGYGSKTAPTSSGAAEVFSPQYSTSDQVETCAEWSNGCWAGTTGTATEPADFSGAVTLPSNQGGMIYVSAACLAQSGAPDCDQGGNEGVWAGAWVSWAQALLTNASVPSASGFGGSALSSSASGSAQLTFTATDTNGPGVYTVSASVDGNQIYSGTPSSNNGECVSHGTYPNTSALEFDYAQPCPQSEGVTIPIDTTTLSNGAHDLTVTVTDAAGNGATVFNQNITVDNPGPVAQLSLAPRLKVLSRKCAIKRVKVKTAKSKTKKTVKRKVCTTITTLGKAGAAVTRPGHPGHAYGLLLSAAGTPLAKAAITVNEQVPGHGTRKLKPITTGANGRFSLALKGPSGTYRFSYAGDSANGAASASQPVTATTSTTFALPKRIYAPSSFSAHGMVKGGYTPRKGLPVSLYYRVVGYGNDWHSFGPRIRTDKRGAWHAKVPVPAGARGYTYQFRARIKSQQGWPYADALSATVTRRIR